MSHVATVGALPLFAARAAALLVLAGPAWGQREAPPDLRVAHPLDTGRVENTGARPEVIIAFTVSDSGAQSLRLYFESIELSGDLVAGTGSILRVTSLQDGAAQTLDATECRQWQNSTAYFNGSVVLVEVLAQPGTGGNRLVLSHVDAGQAWSMPKSQCGPTDNRVPSSDPRVGRLMPVACTAWMIADCGHCFLTAGHCVGNINLMQFNVPPSTSSGALQNPPPQHQYAVDQSSIQSNGGLGVGNDFAYFGCFPNSSTGFTAFQAQGLAFTLSSPPPVAGNTIRITGYGSDSTPLTSNQIQQTSTGPFTASFGNTVQYQTDSEGGNSGSPVIWDQADEAIGIHAHAGCSTGGGGANQGTSINHPGLQSMLSNPTGVCAASCAFSSLGGGISGFSGLPQLTATGTLLPNTAVTLLLAQVKIFTATTLVVGFSQLQAPFKGGVMVPYPDVVIGGLATGLGSLVFPFTWPTGVPSGFQTWYQFWTPDAVAVHGFSASNALLGVTP